MEWDGGTIWRIALGVFFLACGVGASYALFRLGYVLKKAGDVLGSVDSQIVPLLTRVETTIDGVNSELDKVDGITGSVAEILKVAEKTTTAVHRAVSAPLRALGGLAITVKSRTKSMGGVEKEEGGQG